MCGFSVYSKGRLDLNQALQRSNAFVGFRGRSDTQLYETKHHLFIHHRLSIVDHINGAQPIITSDGVLVYNGEIHNYKDLAKEYFGCSFTGDTQFLSRVCSEQRYDILAEIDGYFAFVYYNRKTAQLTVARDLYGEKPLYASGDMKNFSSSLNDVAVLQKPSILQKIKCIFAEERREWQKLLFTNYYEVPPNTLIHISSEGDVISHSRIYTSNVVPYDCTRFMNAVTDAVNNRLVADVKIAQSLSGGKDSGLVNVSLMRSDVSIPRFTIKNTNRNIDESTFVTNIANQYKLDLNIVEIENDITPEQLMQTFVYLEVPAWDLSFIGFHAYYSQIAKHAKVIIEGHGPDELHGGYQDYLLVKLIHILRHRPRLFSKHWVELRQKTGRSHMSLFISAFIFATRGIILRRLEYVSLAHYWRKQDERLQSVLAVFDRVTMSAQIESRSPFLSSRLFSYFNNYRAAAEPELNSKPYINECLARYGDKYPVLEKKIGFTFGENKEYDKYARHLVPKEKLDRLRKLSRFLPSQIAARLLMLQMFRSAHIKFRTQFL